MSQSLLTGGYEWVSNPDKLKSNISELAKNPDKGYVLEVNVSYPNDLHNDLLFMCENRKINEVQNLVPNLFHKKKYVIHTAALDQALRQGLIWK